MVTETVLFGRPGSPGIALGKALVFSKELPVISESKVKNLDHEQSAFQKAKALVSSELKSLLNRYKESATKETAEIIEAHLMMLEDPEWIDGISSWISKGHSASYAVLNASESFIEALEALEDPYLRQRANDIRDISQRVLFALAGMPSSTELLSQPTVLLAKDILPSELLSMNLQNLLGLALEGGSTTSHTSILAKTFEIPLVVGVKGLLATLQKTEKLDSVAINGLRGSVIVNPSKEKSTEFEKQRSAEAHERAELAVYANKRSQTKDGTDIEVASNLSSLLDLDLALKKGTEGVGLFRTEFLLFDRPNMPSENEQFSIYKTALQKLPQHKCVIRTFDIGGDKKVPYLNLPKEENPFLGLRGLRLCLKNHDLFVPQLRALLRASVFGNLAIMAPMVTTVGEVIEFKKLIEKTKNDLINEGQKVSDNFEVGIMIEVPAVALIAGQLSHLVDFFSVGTNDLIQYLCATDRMNEEVSFLHDPYHPGVLKVLKIISDEVKSQGNKSWLGMCGELAAQADYIPLLLALGFYELSVSPGAVLKARQAVCETSLVDAKKLLDKALLCRSSEELHKLLC